MLTDLECAGRCFICSAPPCGGKVAGQNFGGRRKHFQLTRIEPPVAEIHERLAGVVIEKLDWFAFVD